MKNVQLQGKEAAPMANVFNIVRENPQTKKEYVVLFLVNLVY